MNDKEKEPKTTFAETGTLELSVKIKTNEEAVSWTAKDEEEYYNEQKAYRKKHGIPMER